MNPLFSKFIFSLINYEPIFIIRILDVEPTRPKY